MCNYNLPVIQHICNYISITIFSSLYALMYFHFSELSCTSAINFHGQTIGYTKARYNVYSNCCCAFCLSSFWIKAFFSSSGSALNMKTDLSPMSSWMVKKNEIVRFESGSKISATNEGYIGIIGRDFTLMGCWNFLAAKTVKRSIHTPKRVVFVPLSIKPDCA